MTHGKIRSVGLCVLAMLSLSVFGVASAQAANEFLLLHPGHTFAEENVMSETFDGELEPGEPFRILVPGELFEISCANAQINMGRVYATLLHAKVLLNQCTMYELNPDPVADYYSLVGGEIDCEVIGRSMEMIVKAVPVLHKKETFLLFEALEKGQSVFDEFHFKGFICPPESSITGTVVSTIKQLNSVAQLFGFSPKTTLLFQEAELPGDELQYAESEVFLEGDLYELKLTGPLAGQAWGAH